MKEEIPVNYERISVLCIAYHNMGVELEFLKRVINLLSLMKLYRHILKQLILLLNILAMKMTWSKILKMFLTKLKIRFISYKDKCK
jgi:hypothetical protein